MVFWVLALLANQERDRRLIRTSRPVAAASSSRIACWEAAGTTAPSKLAFALFTLNAVQLVISNASSAASSKSKPSLSVPWPRVWFTISPSQRFNAAVSASSNESFDVDESESV